MESDAQTLVIGAGPAGLMAAQELARAGCRVTLVDAKPSVGRKLLMAGKSGLNLTNDEATEDLLAHYGASSGHLAPMIREFDAGSVMRWAEALGQPVFTGSSGRVFPRTMKASPLLRAWLARLGELGVEVRTRWRWTGWQDAAFRFSTPAGQVALTPAVAVLALGGASWARLGSDGAWAEWLAGAGVSVTPFRPANVGLTVGWSPHMAPLFGTPVKGTALIAGPVASRGEFVISSRGLEGGGIYSVSAQVRDGAALRIDLLPDLPLAEVTRRLSRSRGRETLTNHLRKSLHLDRSRLALLREFGPDPLPGGAALAQLMKDLPVSHAGPRPLDEAISSAGGIAWEALDEGLMLRLRPGTFAAGEMLDWEAPTGGYLLTACLATGRWAGRHAARWALG